MKKYILKKKGESESLGKFSLKSDAADEMQDIIDNNNEEFDANDDDYLTPFDFELEEVEEAEEADEPSVAIPDFKAACKYLNLWDYVTIRGHKKYMMAAEAFYKLSVIAEAWNKMDDFVPDFTDLGQYKYFPWFKYDKGSAGFVCSYSSSSAATANAALGSRLCFKTSERAKQFGKQFIDLYNQMFL